MGNCMSPISTQRQQHEGDDEMEQPQVEEKAEHVKKNSSDGAKISIVLTKKELEWLVFQLKVHNGGKKLEDILGEIERWRGKGAIVNKAWKPSLESIMECPEMEIR